MLRKCGATLGLLDQLSQFETQQLNERFVGKYRAADGNQRDIDLSRHIQSPANWRLPTFNEFLTDPYDMVAACKLKWSFRIKPDLVIHTDNNHALCIELKLESAEGRYPSDGEEKRLLSKRNLSDEK